ncbi:MAG TPA: helix-turn-helix domain-containing protein [Candidatus Limnocylindrales bacterium]
MPPMQLVPDGPDLTVQEVANHLRVTKTTVYRYLNKGIFPGAWQTEEAWRIPQRDVIAYRERNQAGTDSEV